MQPYGVNQLRKMFLEFFESYGGKCGGNGNREGIPGIPDDGSVKEIVPAGLLSREKIVAYSTKKKLSLRTSAHAGVAIPQLFRMLI